MTPRDTNAFRDRMAATWLTYLESPDRASRDHLIESYLFLVRDTAKRAHTRLAGRVPLDDLESAGTLGLMDAVDAFDPRRGIAFETFAVYRIRGAMLDEVRALDWVPRTVRTTERKLLAGRAAIAQALGRDATHAELADHLNLPLDTVLKMDRQSRPTQVFSLNALVASPRGAGDDGRTNDPAQARDANLLRATPAPDPAAHELREELYHNFLRKLPRTEQLIVNLYYVEGLTFRQIGLTLALSEGRVSQIHARALLRLRELAGVIPPADRTAVHRPRRPACAGHDNPAPHTLAA